MNALTDRLREEEEMRENLYSSLITPYNRAIDILKVTSYRKENVTQLCAIMLLSKVFELVHSAMILLNHGDENDLRSEAALPEIARSSLECAARLYSLDKNLETASVQFAHEEKLHLKKMTALKIEGCWYQSDDEKEQLKEILDKHKEGLRKIEENNPGLKKYSSSEELKKISIDLYIAYTRLCAFTHTNAKGMQGHFLSTNSRQIIAFKKLDALDFQIVGDALLGALESASFHFLSIFGKQKAISA